MKNKDLFRLHHILECCDKIEKITQICHKYEIFETKWIEQDAMLRNFEIIGEASNHISENIKKQYSDIPWDIMRGMRNFVIHEYFGVSQLTIWETAINDISPLKLKIEKIIANFENEKII